MSWPGGVSAAQGNHHIDVLGKLFSPQVCHQPRHTEHMRNVGVHQPVLVEKLQGGFHGCRRRHP
jgi:hypothetical protein